MDKEQVKAIGLTGLGVASLAVAIGVGVLAINNMVAGDAFNAACDAGIALCGALCGGIGLVDGIKSIKEEF